LYDEITSYDWVKSFIVDKKDVLNYFRMCDILANTYRDYCNHVSGSNKIKEYLLCNKPILCSRGKERERELGKDYIGLYDCETCNSVPPLCWTREYLKNPNCYINLYNTYFKNIDNQSDNRFYIETNNILTIIEELLYTSIHNKNYKHKKIGIYQENLAIRSYKLGLSLYLQGFDIFYLYYKNDFEFNYESSCKTFYTIKKFSYNQYNEFKEYIKILNDLIFINAWENFAVNTLYYDPCYYVGDLWLLRQNILTNPSCNASILNETKIFTTSSRLIFTNKYMIKSLREKVKLKLSNYPIIQNSLFVDEKFMPIERNYLKKTRFNFVYIGSVSLPNTPNHRDMMPLFEEIIKYNPNIFIDVYVTKVNLDQLKELTWSKNIKLLPTLSQNFLSDTLNKYDYGLVIFNNTYKDAEYLDISQPNKMFDYYFSNLPIISINSDSFNDFINNNNLGIIVNNMNITEKMLQKTYFSKGEYNKLESYQTMLQGAYQFIDKKQNVQLYTSPALKFFKKAMLKKFQLTEVNFDNHKDKCIFFGIYTSDDLINMLKFKGEKIYIPGGSDIHRNLIVKNNIKNIEKQHIKIFCQSKHIYNTVLKFYPKQLTYLNPITPVFINDFYKPFNVKGKYIYIYTSQNTDVQLNVYGKKFYTEVIDKLSHKYNFIIATHATYENIQKVYEKCFVGLRLTTLDGLGATNIELGLMGIKSISNNISPNCLSWKNVDDIIYHIENESKNIGKTDYKLAVDVKNFISVEHNIFV